MIGQTLGRYQIEEKIGQGGMGVVYRAHDQRLNRDVAIKVLPPGLFAEEASRRRFRKEALALARLNHPNIATIYDFDSHEGVDFLVTEYIAGTTLSEKLRSGLLRTGEVVQLGRQVCDGLASAHECGIVHRDLKPANLRVTTDGRIKILDFGLARLLEQPPTDLASTQSLAETHILAGTLPYMAPEQLRGENADARSDIYSNGLVLYEMATGHQAFPQSKPAELIGAILHEDPKRPSAVDGRVSPDLERIILKSIDKKPERRYQSAKEMGVDLDRLGSPLASTMPSASQIHRHKPRLSIVLRITLFVAIIAIGASVWTLKLRKIPSRGQQPSEWDNYAKVSDRSTYLAVLPLSASAQDAPLAYIGEGISTALYAKFLRLDGVHLSSPSEISKIGVAAPFSEVARTLGANLIASGSVQGRDQEIQVAVELKEVPSGKPRTSIQVNGLLQNLVKLSDDIFIKLVAALGLHPPSDQMLAAATNPTDNPEAYDLYLRGMSILRANEPETAMLLFSRALSKDSNFALASAAMAEACVEMYRSKKSNYWSRRALDFAKRANRTNKNLPEVYFLLGGVYEALGKSAEAIAELRRGLQLAPNSDDAYVQLGNALMKGGQNEEAIGAYRKAIEVNPYYWGHHIVLGNAYFSTGATEQALAEFKRVTELDPENVRGWDNLGNALQRLGRAEESIPAYQKSIKLKPTWSAYSNLGNTDFNLKRYNDAIQAFEKASELDPNQELAMGNLADAYRASGQNDKAKATYEKAIALALHDLQVNPKNTGAMADLALYYAKTGDAKHGMEFIQRARKIDKKDVGLIYVQATVESLAHRPTDALRTLREAVSKGYSIKDVENDPELAVLRTFPEFDQMWKEFVSNPH